MDQEAKKAVLRLIPYGLFAVTARDSEGEAGMTANWLTQVSFDPPLVAVAVEADARTLAAIRASGHFTVNVLPSGQREMAGLLGRRSKNVPDKLQQTPHHASESGSPILDVALGYVECRVQAEMPAGDHALVVGEVIEAGLASAGEPLALREDPAFGTPAEA